MPTQENKSRKLLPLRHFADEKLYSTSYLSQLVQRKRLKAEKIGRNYYTCEKWFKEYLEMHACDEKRKIHEKIKNGKLKDYNKIYKYMAAAATVAVFIFFVYFGLTFFKESDREGQVAGEFESNVATSSDINVVEFDK